MLKLSTERSTKVKVVATPQVTTKSLLETAKRNSDRVVIITTSNNRASKRAEVKQNVRCNNNGSPTYLELNTLEEQEKFKVARHNKKVMRDLSYTMKNGIGYSKQAMKQASKIVKSTAKKYTAEDKVQAGKIVGRLGQYPNLICIEDLASKLERVVA